jgi:hypothetical protein
MAVLSGVSNDRRKISLFDSQAYAGSKIDGCFFFPYEVPKEHADGETSSSSLRPSVCVSVYPSVRWLIESYTSLKGVYKFIVTLSTVLDRLRRKSVQEIFT